MDLEQLKAQAKGVPPIAWVIGIGVVLLLLMFKGKSAGSGVVGPAGGGSGGGDSSPDLNQEFTTFAAQQQAEQAAFEKTITDLIKKPSAGGSGSTGGAAGSVSKTLLTISKHSTAIYSKPGGKIVGHVSTASFYVQRQRIGGRWWYKVLGTKSGAKSSFVGKYLPAEPWENIKTVTAPK